MQKYRQSKDVVCRTIADETLLVPIRGTVAEMDRLFALEGCARDMWGQLEDLCSLEDITAAIVDRYDVDPACARADAEELLEELLERGLAVRATGSD